MLKTTLSFLPLWLRRLLADWVLVPLAPDWSRCGRCRAPWKFCDSHTSWYTENNGALALCERCWGSLEPYGRLPYYREKHQDKEDWTFISYAVMGGE